MKFKKNFLPFFFFLTLFCIGVQLINNVVIISGEPQKDLAIYIYVCVCVCVCVYSASPKLPPIQAATQHSAEFPVLYSRSLLVIHFKYRGMNMFIPNSLTDPLPLLPPYTTTINSSSKSVSLCRVINFLCIISFQGPRIRDVVCYFSSSALLH